jgi:hypothetical protein
MEIVAIHGFSLWVEQDFHRDRPVRCVVLSDF